MGNERPFLPPHLRRRRRPDGLRIVDKSNWIGKALVFPRALLPQVKARPELAQTSAYLNLLLF